MSGLATVPENRRSEQQRYKLARFEEFGCTFCHQANRDKMSLTIVGTKLSSLHMGCVEVEKQLATAPARH